MRKIKLLFYIGLSVLFCIILANRVVILSTQDKIFSETTELKNAEYILVLGAAKNGKNGLNPYFKKRMTATIDLYFSGKAKKIIVSGDNSRSDYNEPKDMADYLIAHGVPKSDIIYDYAGFRTFDSVIRAKKVFHASSLIIVSQRFHLERALYIANHEGIPAQGYEAKDVGSRRNITHFREYLAKVLVLIDLHLLKTSPKFL